MDRGLALRGKTEVPRIDCAKDIQMMIPSICNEAIARIDSPKSPKFVFAPSTRISDSQEMKSILTEFSADIVVPRTVKAGKSVIKNASFDRLKSTLEPLMVGGRKRAQAQTLSHFRLTHQDILCIRRAVKKGQVIVFTLGGTISCNQTDGVLQPSRRRGEAHEEYNTSIIAKTPVDSSQMTRADMDGVLDSLKKAIELGATELLVEFGTDSAGFLVNRIVDELGPLIGKTGSKVLIATSMTSNIPQRILAKRLHKVQAEQEAKTVALFVGFPNEDQVYCLGVEQSTRLQKSGTKLEPFEQVSKGSLGFLPKELSSLAKYGYELVLSNPTKSEYDIVKELKSTKSNKVILVGLGDYNFFAQPAVLKVLKMLQAKGKSIRVSTSFSGSFEAPDLVPYLPRHKLEALGCQILTQQEALELLKKQEPLREE